MKKDEEVKWEEEKLVYIEDVSEKKDGVEERVIDKKRVGGGKV